MTRDEKRRFAYGGPAWTYEFDLGDGILTPLIAEELRSIHQTRTELIMPAIDRQFPGGLTGTRCLDIGCNEGYFSHLLYQRGASVTGIDIRETNIQRAEAVRSILNLDPARLQFQRRDLFDLEPAVGAFDIVFFLGLLYHIENPMGANRLLQSLTKTICVIETQLTRQREPLYSGWGQESVTLELPASIAILNEAHQETDSLAAHNSLSFIPNAEAVRLMLAAAGFERVEQMRAAPAMNRQYVRNDRAVFIAWNARR
jgi:SAM-dependent methyltransferase